jgi:uncharacterized protein YbjT (DUF2867 family)
MATSLLVTGGTGTLGGHVLPRLRAAGRDVRVLSRRARDPEPGVEYAAGDLLAGDGLDAALDGIDTVLHLAGGPKGDDVVAANLVAAAVRAGVRHLVYISVIGADTVPLGYFRAKYAAERAIAESGIPFTTLRAAQFHDLTLKVATTMAKLPVLPAPGGLRWQPVDSRDVADRLVELTLGAPSGRVADLAGPEVATLADLSRAYLQVRGKRRLTLPIRMPGKVGRAYRGGDNLNLDTATRGTRTWADFLAERTAEPAAAK